MNVKLKFERSNVKVKKATPGLRKGRGFSKNELKGVNLSFYQAKVKGIPVDERRKSSHQENIDTLKELTAK